MSLDRAERPHGATTVATPSFHDDGAQRYRRAVIDDLEPLGAALEWF